jgi:uncharacterized protein (TIGR02145 family)
MKHLKFYAPKTAVLFLLVFCPFAFLLLYCAPAARQGASSAAPVKIKNVAVVEVEIDEQSGASKEINKNEVRRITGALRREAVNHLPKGRFNVMTTETVQAMGEAVLIDCAEENCVIALGSKIGADYIVRGIIGKFQESFTLEVEMYETEYGNLVGSASLVRSADILDLLEKGAAACAEMFKQFAGTGVAAAPTPKPMPKPTPTPMPTPTPTPVAPSPVTFGTFTDRRDGKTYRTVKINGMTWMAENLNYATANSRCRNNSESHCKEYGRLYNWDAARGACPAGWHWPSREEWNGLIVFAGGAAAAGEKLKSKSPNWDGANDYGFSALPGGISYIDPDIGSADDFTEASASQGYWWAATQHGSLTAYCYVMSAGYTFVVESYYDKKYAYSVRCVQN